jgi:hypothetical protein
MGVGGPSPRHGRTSEAVGVGYHPHPDGRHSWPAGSAENQPAALPLCPHRPSVIPNPERGLRAISCRWHCSAEAAVALQSVAESSCRALECRCPQVRNSRGRCGADPILELRVGQLVNLVVAIGGHALEARTTAGRATSVRRDLSRGYSCCGVEMCVPRDRFRCRRALPRPAGRAWPRQSRRRIPKRRRGDQTFRAVAA